VYQLYRSVAILTLGTPPLNSSLLERFRRRMARPSLQMLEHEPLLIARNQEVKALPLSSNPRRLTIARVRVQLPNPELQVPTQSPTSHYWASTHSSFSGETRNHRSGLSEK
jgi:hypothetical protein